MLVGRILPQIVAPGIAVTSSLVAQMTSLASAAHEGRGASTTPCEVVGGMVRPSMLAPRIVTAATHAHRMSLWVFDAREAQGRD